MEFNDLLAKQNIDPKEVLGLRHRPKEPRFHKALPLMAVDRPDLYNAYLQTQTPQVQAANQFKFATTSQRGQGIPKVHTHRNIIF